MKAYDINIAKSGITREDENVQGWCFGLPPGISSEQWPLDPNSGYPLMHGFTLKIPEDWRDELSGLYAVSFFAIPPDHNDGGPETTEGLYDIIKSPPAELANDHKLSLFWAQAKQQHPKLHRMEDILGCEYAIIPLTEQEYRGSFTQPPLQFLLQVANLLEAAKPEWLEQGAAYAFGRPDSQRPELPFLKTYIGKAMGRVPQRNIEEHFPFYLEERPDPNAGKQPEEPWEGEIAENGYEIPFKADDGSYEIKEWAKDMAANHLGGTMRPVQGYPDVSAYYIEFEEYFGGYNFGGGNAQLCLKTYLFDWACG